MKSILALLFTAASVAAHGYVATVTIDGKPFKGNVPNGATNPSIIRQISDVSPVKGANNPSVNCGLNAKPASLVADANPGSVFEFDWRGGDNSNWPHNTGPMFTYLASCGSQTCDKFDSTKAKWFKIQQVGRTSNGGPWAQQDLMNGGTAQVTLPKNLAPGNYLIRHEILALHLAPQMGGAEFYPSCAQIRVSGSQSGTPSPNDLVSLPGAYRDNDPGIFDPSVFDNNAKYTFPGPPIPSFISGGSSSSSSGPSGNGSNNDNNGDDDDNNGDDDDNSNPNSSSPSPSSSSSSPKPSSTSSGSSGSCKLKKNNSSSNTTTTNAKRDVIMASKVHHHHRPRTISRVMRGLVYGETH